MDLTSCMTGNKAPAAHKAGWELLKEPRVKGSPSMGLNL